MLDEDRKTSKESTPYTESSDKNLRLEDNMTPAMTINKKMSNMEATIQNLKVCPSYIFFIVFKLLAS